VIWKRNPKRHDVAEPRLKPTLDKQRPARADEDDPVRRLRYQAAVHVGSIYAGHSLRAGFLTEATNNRASIFKMQDVSQHKSMQALSEYVRRAELFDDHAGAQFL